MDSARWDAVSALFDEGLELPPPARSTWLRRLALRDAALAATVGRMLEHAVVDPPLPLTSATFDVFLERALRHDAHAENDASLAGQRLGHWLLERKIGEGGMGQVWLARRVDGLYEAQAAIKLLRGDLQRTLLSARFDRERAALARLNHPGIAKLLDAGVTDGHTYLVLEYVPGLLLTDHAAASCPTVASRVQLLIRVAQAVEHAHAQLIVHRDLKPSNVIVTHDGTPKLLDFGIAGLIDDGPDVDGELTRHVGRGLTLGYAAPEQITGAPIGIAADVFALGVMTYQLLSGSLPFATAGATRVAAEHAVLHGEPGRLGGAGTDAAPIDFRRVRGDLEAIVAKALRKDPAARHGSVTALIDDLQRWLEFRPVSARREDWRHRGGLWLRRNALPAGLSAAVVVALVGGMAATTLQSRRTDAAAHESDQVTTYLTDLLAGASPDVHGGEWPNVLQILDKSRTELPTKFVDEPDVKVRLLDVLASTYNDLNRYDLAIPLANEWVALASARYGDDDPRTIAARLKLASIYVPMGPWDKVIELLEPLKPKIAAKDGASSETMQGLLHSLAIAQIRTGRLDAAAANLREAKAITDVLQPSGDFRREFHHNYVSTLYTAEGRLRDALAELRATEPYQRTPPADYQRFALVLRRNTLDTEIRLAQYDHVEERIARLRLEMDRLLGPGNAMVATLRPLLPRYDVDRGDFAAALAAWESTTDDGRNVRAPIALVQRAEQLWTRALAGAATPAALAADARGLLAEIEASRAVIGSMGGEAWLMLARVGLLIDDRALVTDIVRRLQNDADLQLDRNHDLGSRVAQVEGELARADGDLPRSAALLEQRVAHIDQGRDVAVPYTWKARLDLAFTRVLARDPRAPADLSHALRERPPGLPAGNPLDAVQSYLQAAWDSGGASTPAAIAAGRRVQRAYGGTAGHSGAPEHLAGFF